MTLDVTSSHSAISAHLLALKTAHFWTKKYPLMGDKEEKREGEVSFAYFVWKT